ncbi:esterase FrsA [Biostraticola tofi]|uniref:Esterase FrsA n=1 Tax=Biostraticola tofi TaxID=466109 RepID=A0A4R3YH02_9GAMM|nr:esterase FrsA [Biostraticola tofi]TCV91557.1 esterase FrsA [Biostraticola tofi]
MSQKNLSETLFKPTFKHRETSTLVSRARHNQQQPVHATLDGENPGNWYRMLNRLMWIWRGVNPWELEEVLSRIAASTAERTDPRLLDTVIGYRNGNWIYEWSHQGMIWQQRAMDETDPQQAGKHWLQAANFYSIASYPHLKGDELAEQAQTLANRAWEEASTQLNLEIKALTFPLSGGGQVTGFLHLPPQGRGPFPTVLVCGGLDMLQNDTYRLFHDYLAPAGLAMLTVDMPSIGFSAKCKLTQDSSALHQQVLQGLSAIPWIDSRRISALGFRFGGNIAVRLAYLESKRLCAVATLGPVVHALLTDGVRQRQAPDMYLDVLASRTGMPNASDMALKTELSSYSLKNQGLLGRRCPTPMLAGYWKNDPFSPKQESELVASSSLSGKLLQVNSAPVYQGFHTALLQICDWLKKY